MDVISPIEMEGIALPGGMSSRCTYAAVLCCICGSRMSAPSPQSTCLACLAQQTDITEGISRSVVLPCCVTCGRYMHTPNRWLSCELESRELMALMLQKIRGLKKVAKVLDSNWIWREPHSRRVSLKLTVQKEILNGRASVQQAFLVEGIIQNTQCDDCKKSFTPHAGWTAMVQVRQHADHKRTLLFLEQLVLKHHLASRLLNVIEKPDGLDFCFSSRQVAVQFSAFCESRFPCLSKQSKQLISHDASNNTHFHKYTISVTLAPLCRDDLVYIRRKQAHAQLGGFSSLALCSRVAGAGIQLLDPFTNRTTHVSVEKYWHAPFAPLCTRKHLSSFLVLDVTPVDAPSSSSSSNSNSSRSCGFSADGGALRPHQQRQQKQEVGQAAHSARVSRKARRRRHQMLEGPSNFAAETEDEDWDKKQPFSNGTHRRDHYTKAAAIRRKRHLVGGGLPSSEQERETSRRNSTLSLSGESFAGVTSASSLHGIPAVAASPADPYTQSLHAKVNSACTTPMRAKDAQNKEISQTRGKIQNAPGRMRQDNRMASQVWEVELMRGCDVGVCDRKVITRTHLGSNIQPGDWVQGYDLRSINLAGAADSQLDEDARSCGGGSSRGGHNKGNSNIFTSRQQHARKFRDALVNTSTHTGERKNTSDTSAFAEDMDVEESIETESIQSAQGHNIESQTAGSVGGEMKMREENDVTREKEEKESSLLEDMLGSVENIVHENDEESALLRCVQFEVIIVKKQPLQRLCAAAEDGKGGGGNFLKRNNCKVRPWVLQTLRKERDNEYASRRGNEKKGMNSRRHQHDSDAEMEAFKQELEEDPEMRAEVNLWKDPRYNVSEERKERRNHAQSRRMKKMKNHSRAQHGEDRLCGKVHDNNSLAGRRNEGGDRNSYKTTRRDNIDKGIHHEKKENGHIEPDTWEDINDTDEESSSLEDNDEIAGVKLAELLEGLTLEDGKLKGAIVNPGEAQVPESEDSATKETPPFPVDRKEDSEAECL